MGHILDNSAVISFTSNKNQRTNKKPVSPGITFQASEIKKQINQPYYYGLIYRINTSSPLFKLCPYFSKNKRTTKAFGDSCFQGTTQLLEKIIRRSNFRVV